MFLEFAAVDVSCEINIFAPVTKNHRQCCLTSHFACWKPNNIYLWQHPLHCFASATKLSHFSFFFWWPAKGKLDLHSIILKILKYLKIQHIKTQKSQITLHTSEIFSLVWVVFVGIFFCVFFFWKICFSYSWGGGWVFFQVFMVSFRFQHYSRCFRTSRGAISRCPNGCQVVRSYSLVSLISKHKKWDFWESFPAPFERRGAHRWDDSAKYLHLLMKGRKPGERFLKNVILAEIKNK